MQKKTTSQSNCIYMTINVSREAIHKISHIQNKTTGGTLNLIDLAKLERAKHGRQTFYIVFYGFNNRYETSFETQKKILTEK